jgi:hypothetical protein
VAKQKEQLLALIDSAAKLRLNALIFQVRPAGDAMYASALEPWSPFLTGEMGKSPSPLMGPARVCRHRVAQARDGTARLVQSLPGSRG